MVIIHFVSPETTENPAEVKAILHAEHERYWQRLIANALAQGNSAETIAYLRAQYVEESRSVLASHV